MTYPPTTPASAGSTQHGLSLLRLAIALGFVAGVAVLTWASLGHISLTLVVAAVFGAYMAMNIGANDVANNVGPAVGAKAMTMTKAIAIAAVFEALGAVIAGGDVVGTVKSGIIDPTQVADAQTFVWLMMAALLAGALWLNLATAMGAPVSTTHSIVGGVLGAGIAASGWDVADWNKMGQIAASWVISPLMGGLIAAGTLYGIKRSITYQIDLTRAAQRVVPVLIAAMAWAFTTYLLLKGLSQVVKIGLGLALVLGAALGAAVWYGMSRRIGSNLAQISNDREGVNQLFTVPLMFAAALLSFAHGSNDVANAIGPLAAIHDTLVTAAVSDRAAIPGWIMALGAIGLALGLALYGPKLIRTVGSEITEIDPMRAYCIAMASALTVIVASQLGLPISTTHVAIGAVFGVGFLREYLKANYDRILQAIHEHHLDQEAEHHVVEEFLQAFRAAPVPEKDRMLKTLKREGKLGPTAISKQERKSLRKVYRKSLVKRSVFMRVIAAWIITVPASALMAAVIFYAIRGAMLP
ncbi:inorganic phosphate transporter [Panacagrimonas sp.]|uniref:inorganic phosphate transporter n=1 Tax=Panacagrimonas sp. TaxID=2480088 RepID=UPI003B51F89D